MYIRKRIAIRARDITGALWTCVVAARGEQSRGEAHHALSAAWRPDGAGLACLSVRSGFDLMLGCMDWTKGSEVIMSAITIPDMARIVRHHGFAPVPVDLDLGSLECALADIEAAITPRTRAIVVAHLFGARLPMDALSALAARHGLLLIEDCAQAYDGPAFTGHVGADVSMFSFGTIKTATCLGGALFTIHDQKLRDMMRQRQGEYPLQSRRDYALKLLKYLAILALGKPLTFGLFVGMLTRLGHDYDAFLRRLSQSFAGPDFFAAIRRQPSTPLVRLLRRRLSTYEPRELALRTVAGQRFYGQLAPSVRRFGEDAAHHTHWLVPIVVANPDEVITALRAAGFDATSGSSTLIAIDGDGLEPPTIARDAMARVVYLPVYPQVPGDQIDRMAAVVNATARSFVTSAAPELPPARAKERRTA